MYMYIRLNNRDGEKVLQGKTDATVSYDTQYGRVLIYNRETIDGNKMRVLNIDSGYESATYINEGKEYDLVFPYTKYYDLMFNSNIKINKVALIGGAGYSYPKHFISTYTDKNLDVIEIDGDITKIAKKYFFLDKLIEEYDLNNNKRLNLINEDGRVYFNNTKTKYDAILNDAFSGNCPAKTLTTIENVTNLKRCLNEKGCYLTNIISSLEGENSKFLRAEVNTLKQVFNNVYVVPCFDLKDTELIGNNMVIATDDTLILRNVYNLVLSNDEIVLTDEYCPLDYLIPTI